MEFDFNKKFTKQRLIDFSDLLKEMQETIDFKVSSRGWCYLMEQAGHIDKGQFDKVDNAINTCRKEGLLPVDFVADESSRAFSGVEFPTRGSIKGVMKRMLDDVLTGYEYFTPDWWKDEEYYIQILVEKVDLKTLFEPICRKFHIPIANAKGWSSILQRAEYARRFKEAEENGLKCVLLYCGDHDPDGLRISDTIRKNLEQLSSVEWNDGEQGYDPSNLIIERFGLNYDFIIDNGYIWIDNLVSQGGSLARVVDGEIVAGIKTKGKNMGKPHQNFKLPYLQNYISNYGVRKCEANVLVTTPDIARNFIEQTIVNWLGEGAEDRYKAKMQIVEDEYNQILDNTGLRDSIERAIEE